MTAEYSFTDWAADLDLLACDVLMGVSVFDLPDEEIEMLRECFRAGMTIFEVFDQITGYDEGSIR